MSKTYSISTETLGTPLDATHYLSLTSNFPNPFTSAPNGPVVINSIEGYCGGTGSTQYWLQILNGAPGNTLPMYSVQVVGGNGFSFVYPNGLSTSTMSDGSGASFGENIFMPYLAISSTDKTYTAVAAPTNVRVDIDMSYQMPTTLQQPASATNAASLTVFGDPNVTNFLAAIAAVNNTGAIGYLMLFSYANPAVGAVPMQEWTVTNGATLQQTFGAGGCRYQQGKPDYTIHTGCYLVASSTPQVLTAVANGWNLYAWFI